MTGRILCEQANQINLVEYLEGLGFLPKLIRNDDYWYLSPFRDEKTPSFKVNQQKNLWYDHGMGKGGTLVDFGILYHRCSVRELLLKLETENPQNLSFHQHKKAPAGEGTKEPENPAKIKIVDIREINDPGLQQYLQYRKVPLDIARQFCKEIRYELHGKGPLAIGFKNDLGGYELRSPYFKASSSPKAPTIISNADSNELAIFEGFFDFLSFQTIRQKQFENKAGLPIIQADSLILNSVSFFEKTRQRMEKYERIHLFLDHDKTGRKATRIVLGWSSKYIDRSKFYEGFKDLNEFLATSTRQRVSQKRDKGLRH